jgi:Mg/Co/Ni transporter MgtE
MKFLTALDCLSSRVKRVLEEDRPPRQVPENTLYAVFTHDIHTGTFCGLASQYDIVLHPDWIFADLVEHRPLESVMPDTPLNQVFDRMRKLQCEALPVLDEHGNFLGAISSGSLLEKLLRQ